MGNLHVDSHHVNFSHLQVLFKNHLNFLNFMCIWPWIRRRSIQNLFFHRYELMNLHIYTHHFLALISAFTIHFLRFARISRYFCVLAYRFDLQRPKKNSKKSYEYLHNELGNIHIYLHHFLHLFLHLQVFFLRIAYII